MQPSAQHATNPVIEAIGSYWFPATRTRAKIHAKAPVICYVDFASARSTFPT